jgi:pantoate--beta-alanine ligase
MSLASRIVPSMVIQTHKTVQAFRHMRRQIPQGTKIGFVPTMGALHEGHLSLVKEARENNDVVVASIYVNPTQFGPNDDLDKYPRRLERDTELLNDMGVDHLFAPSEMYGKDHVCYVEPQGFDDIAEGQARPGHFRGVATIVNKLFNIIQPTNAYFGQKDAAQCVLIKRLVDDLQLDVNVCIMETIREKDGLAMSSRNVYLNVEERKAAIIIYQSLCAAREMFHSLTSSDEVLSTKDVKERVTSVLTSEPMVTNIQYVAVDSKETMQPLDEIRAGEGAIISIACQVGSVRLIDNFML